MKLLELGTKIADKQNKCLLEIVKIHVEIHDQAIIVIFTILPLDSFISFQASLEKIENYFNERVWSIK